MNTTHALYIHEVSASAQILLVVGLALLLAFVVCVVEQGWPWGDGK